MVTDTAERTEGPTIYEKAITTNRPAEMLAQKHGYESLADLVEHLPENATVLDLGAGCSPFGVEVATVRPDITWVNFDYSYHDPDILEDASRDAPENVKFVAGDATKLGEMYTPETFDVVFSYWMFPHLSLDESEEPVRKAAEAVFSVAKTPAYISIGPDVSHKLPLRKQEDAYHIVKRDTLRADDFVAEIVDRTRLRGIRRRFLEFQNEVATPYFGSSRYTKRVDGALHVYDPETGEYVPRKSQRGLKVIKGLAIAGLQHVRAKDM